MTKSDRLKETDLIRGTAVHVALQPIESVLDILFKITSSLGFGLSAPLVNILGLPRVSPSEYVYVVLT